MTIEKIGKPSKNAMFDERLTVIEGKINEIVEFLGLLPIEPPPAVEINEQGDVVTTTPPEKEGA